MPNESTEDDSDDERVVDDKTRELATSINPLKANFGIDIGLPWPLPQLLHLGVWTYFIIVRLIIYSAIGLVVFIASFLITSLSYCSLSSPNAVKSCLLNDVGQVSFILPNFVFAVGLVGVIVYLDYKIEWRRYM